MVRIRVEPGELEAVGQQLQAAAQQMRVVAGGLRHRLAALTWESGAQIGVEHRVTAAATRATGLAGQAQELAAYLARKATQFSQADQESAGRLVQIHQDHSTRLQDDLVQAKHAWWQARLRGDEAAMAAAHARANQLRAMGAVENEAMNQKIRSQYEQRYELISAKQDWWRAWIAGDQAGMEAAQNRAREARAAGAPEPTAEENAGLLTYALVQTKHQWWQARQRWDYDGMQALAARADYLRGQGAVVTPEQNEAINQQYSGPEVQVPPAPGTTGLTVWKPTQPAVTGDPSNRSPERYAMIIDQHMVATNPRYRIRDTSGDGHADTFCNIYLWDVTRAMGAPIPHWVDDNGNPCPDDLVAGARGYDNVTVHGHEMNANATVQWLDEHGPRYGWREVTAEEAQAWANQGKPAVAGWDGSRTKQIGHVAVIRPGQYDPQNGPTIAQAGSHNYNVATVRQGFGSHPLNQVRYFVHD